jgi:hypothetical protein
MTTRDSTRARTFQPRTLPLRGQHDPAEPHLVGLTHDGDLYGRALLSRLAGRTDQIWQVRDSEGPSTACSRRSTGGSARATSQIAVWRPGAPGPPSTWAADRDVWWLRCTLPATARWASM